MLTIVRSPESPLTRRSCSKNHVDQTDVERVIIPMSDEYIKRPLSKVTDLINKDHLRSTSPTNCNTYSKLITKQAPLLHEAIMRLSIIMPALVAAPLAAATPAPGTDSPELVKRYCGDKPPPHPACPKGLFQVSKDTLRANS